MLHALAEVQSTFQHGQCLLQYKDAAYTMAATSLSISSGVVTEPYLRRNWHTQQSTIAREIDRRLTDTKLHNHVPLRNLALSINQELAEVPFDITGQKSTLFHHQTISG